MGVKTYLELGCQYGNTTRKLLGPRRRVIGVDKMKQIRFSDFFEFYQMTTDKFFEKFDRKVDAVFIDADHSFKSVQKDLVNSLKILNEGGVIFIHDTDPKSKELMHPDFCGNGYQIVDWVKTYMKDLDIISLPIDDPGLTIIMRSGS
jgi:predicted O-methyltransferase YrrM